MNKTNERKYFFAIIVFAAILAVSAWGEVKKQVKPAAKLMTQQAPAAAMQTITGVRGHVKYNITNKGMQGVEIALYEGDSQSPLQSEKTNSAGLYAFIIPTDKVGKTLKITAGSGLNQIPFSPNNIEFVLVSGINTMKDIYYTPLNVPMTVKVSTPDSVAISGLKVTEYYVVNGQDIAIENKITNNDGYCKFNNINEINIGKEFVIKPNDPKYQSFNPAEKRFKLANSSPIDFYFTYTGPLPDLVANHAFTFAQGYVSEVSFVVTNQGNAPSGSCKLIFWFKQLDFYGQIKIGPQYAIRIIPALAPGASYITNKMMRLHVDYTIELISYEVDYENVVGESNGSNNVH